MRRYRFIAIAFGIIAIVVFLILLRGDHARLVELPDGKTIELLGTTVGGQIFNTEKRWQKLARRFLPNRWQSWIPNAMTGSCGSGSNSITVFLRVSDPTGARIFGTPWQHYGAEDSDGFRYTREGGYCSFGGGASDQVIGLSLQAFPRRESSFRLHFYDADDAVMTSLTVPNPVKGPFPQWEASPLPQSTTNGPVVLTLESIEYYTNSTWKSIRPRWKLASADPEWKRARARYSVLSDATGNSAQWLSPREPAWRLHTVVHREHEDDFRRDERWSVDQIKVPAEDGFTPIDQETNLRGVTILAKVISSAGKLTVTNGVSRGHTPFRPGDGSHSTTSSGNLRTESWSAEKPFVLLEARNVQPDDEIRITLFDDLGQKINLEDNHGYSGSSAGGRMYAPQFELPPGTKSLSLEIILSRPLIFDFMVNPKDVQTVLPLSE